MKSKIITRYLLIVMFLITASFLQNCSEKNHTIKTIIDNKVAFLYKSYQYEELNNFDYDKIKSFFTSQELHTLATQYWGFDVNVPVIVYVMQDESQAVDPYWLNESGFLLTEMSVKNEHNTFDVWKKQFDAGRINLGINGFDKHRPHYFVSVKAAKPHDNLELSNFFPTKQYVAEMKIGAFTYHDWDELLLEQVPQELVGGKLLTTIRGRAREAHLIHAFRKTKYPSAEEPDQIVLTWEGDPKTSQSVQWRTSIKTNSHNVVRYWKDGNDKDYKEAKAEIEVIEDRLLFNNRFINHYTARLVNLSPASTYQYKIGNPGEDSWSKIYEFKTASDRHDRFSFVYFGDTHKSAEFGSLIDAAYLKYPNTAFYSIAGDIVSTGLYRDDWDQFLHYSENVVRNRPLMPSLGNHDSQDGLGSWMYKSLFDLPKNGPSLLGAEQTYSFVYNNALFLMLDVTASIEDQTAWIEEQLKNSKETWKFAVFHFPPYSYEEDYPVIRKEWGTLFDTYHLDMVFTGHVHYYMRSKPMYDQKPVKSAKEGTIYVISIATSNPENEMPFEEFVDVRFAGDYLYQHIEINNNRLDYKAINQFGVIKDSLSIRK